MYFALLRESETVQGNAVLMPGFLPLCFAATQYNIHKLKLQFCFGLPQGPASIQYNFHELKSQFCPELPQDTALGKLTVFLKVGRAAGWAGAGVWGQCEPDQGH